MLKPSTNFLISFQGSQGSTAIQELLDRHPQIHFVGFEPFDRYRFANDVDSVTKAPMPAQQLRDCFDLLFRGKCDQLKKLYAAYSRRKLALDPTKCQGMKFRLTLEFLWSPKSVRQLIELFNENRVQLFFLRRKNRLLQALSNYKGTSLQFKLANGKLASESMHQPQYFDPKRLA